MAGNRIKKDEGWRRARVLSPVCLRPCICRWDNLKYLLLQPGWAHTNGRFSPASVLAAGGAIPGTRRTSLKEKHKKTSRFSAGCWIQMYSPSRGLMSLTDLDSPEDAVYVVLSTDQHGWRRDRRIAVVAVSISRAGKRGKDLNKIIDSTFTKFYISKIFRFWSHFFFFVYKTRLLILKELTNKNCLNAATVASIFRCLTWFHTCHIAAPVMPG